MSALAVALLLGVWELAPRVGWVREQSVPPFSDVAREAASLLGRPEFLSDLASSGARWAAGFALAVLIGVPLGAWMGRSRRVRRIVDPLLALGYPVPKAALILLFVLWFGAGNVARVGIVVTGCLITIVISAMHGAAGAAPELLWGARGRGRGGVVGGRRAGGAPPADPAGRAAADPVRGADRDRRGDLHGARIRA